MQMRQLRYALSVAKDRSFTKAAARQNISQSAVSNQIRLLEAEIGFDLFQRTSHGIELTEHGRTFLHEAERTVSDMLSLTDVAKRLRGEAFDTLKLGMGSGIAPIFISRLFFKLKQAVPTLQLEISTAPTRSIFHNLQEGRIDLGLGIQVDPNRVPAGLVCNRVDEVEMALIVHPKHRLATLRQPIDVARLSTEAIVMSEMTVGYSEAVMSLFADLGMRPNILAVADNIEMIKAIVQEGVGIAIVPRVSASNEVELGVLRAMRIVPARSVSISLFRRKEPLSRRKEALFDVLEATLKD